MKQKKGSKLWAVMTAITAVLLVVCIVAIPVTSAFATAINVALNAKTQEIVPDPNATIYFWSDYESEEDLVAYEKELCEQIEEEGAALLVNRGHEVHPLFSVQLQSAVRRYRLRPGVRQ